MRTSTRRKNVPRTRKTLPQASEVTLCSRINSVKIISKAPLGLNYWARKTPQKRHARPGMYWKFHWEVMSHRINRWVSGESLCREILVSGPAGRPHPVGTGVANSMLSVSTCIPVSNGGIHILLTPRIWHIATTLAISLRTPLYKLPREPWS